MKRMCGLVVILACAFSLMICVMAETNNSNNNGIVSIPHSIIEISPGIYIELESYGIEFDMKTREKWYTVTLAIYDTKGIDKAKYWASYMTDLGFDTGRGGGASSLSTHQIRVDDGFKRDAHIITFRQSKISTPSKFVGGLGPDNRRFEFLLPTLTCES